YFNESDTAAYARLGYNGYGAYLGGNLYVSGTCSGPSGTCDQDVAEKIDANYDVEAGDVVEISNDGRAFKSSTAYNTRVIGVISTNPAVIF
ncbi:hypothetical protein GWN26_02755, partial [Candidatus Saccharibacteria bacterium]|nr:hypothetical protein [Candidatus Saccharibacteria bacterium]NIV03334.1 hypothetical protein [Calditrichia bacterium]NIS37871.1 hypothetical protein [Candidatus Saccharibacteria bacterium]NIV71538.1 hypothetical protein [Calditrichia bacterium]NIV98115.1 hypothetical protein [Candidatus Saccharibacteria bacterium]